MLLITIAGLVSSTNNQFLYNLYSDMYSKKSDHCTLMLSLISNPDKATDIKLLQLHNLEITHIPPLLE